MSHQEKKDRAFSMIVPHSLYVNLLKIKGGESETIGLNISLGLVCRAFLEIFDFRLYSKLRVLALKKGVTVPKLAKELLENATK